MENMSCEDQAITAMPKYCVIWECEKQKRPLEQMENGNLKYWGCPVCKGSYGEEDECSNED